MTRTHANARSNNAKPARDATRSGSSGKSARATAALQWLASQQGVQAKLQVAPNNDIFEREADQVATAVMRKPATDSDPLDDSEQTETSPASDVHRVIPKAIQRKCAKCGQAKGTGWASGAACPACAAAETELVQAKSASAKLPTLDPEIEPPEKESEQHGQNASDQPSAASNGKKGEQVEPTFEAPETEAKEEPVQTKSLPLAGSRRATTSGSQLPISLRDSKSHGKPMEPAVESDMSQRFGRDLSGVRIHTDQPAVSMNRQLQARAFTHQDDIYFNAGEYQPNSDGGKQLLAHELTHTLQQGAVSDTVQRLAVPDQDVVAEPIPERPNDGAEVEGRMNDKIDNDPDVLDAEELADLDEDERKEAENPDRGEVRSESSEIKSSGASSPTVDRGAAAQQQSETQKAAINQKVETQPAEAQQEQGAAGEREAAEMSEAEGAAKKAAEAEAKANSVPIPAKPEPFKHPAIETPKDSEGKDLPRNSQVDTQVRGLGQIGEMLRSKGYETRVHAAETVVASWGHEAVIERQREDLARAKEGTATMATHNESRREISQKSHEAHAESAERQAFVAENAPDLAGKAEEGQADSGALAAESQSRADQSEGEIPDDPDAKADAEKQSGEMKETAEGAATMDQAIRMAGQRARQYEQDAAQAAEQNVQSEAQIAETEEVIAQTDARIKEMDAKNVESEAALNDVSAGPALMRESAAKSKQTGDALIAATVVMETELLALQKEYLNGMKAIESREAAEKRLKEELEKKQSDPQMSPEELKVVELGGLDDQEQEARIAEMDQQERNQVLATLESMIQKADDQGTDATEGARFKVDTGIGQALVKGQAAAAGYIPIVDTISSALSDPAPDPRQEQIQRVEKRRGDRVGGVLDIADRNMANLTEAQQRMLAERLVAASIADDIKNISVLQMGKEMLKAMVSPAHMLQGVIGGYEKLLTGYANIGNWDAWKKDPLGNLLQVSADITTGLAIIFSSILGIAAAVTALMVALTIFSWGLAAPVTGPVIAWMGTVMTYAGWGAIISGGLAVFFNYLTYIKNLHDAATAESARELFGNTDQMKQNATDGFQGAMAVVEGIGAVKMGPKLSSGEFFNNVPRSPGAAARQAVQSAKEGIGTVVGAPAAVARGARRLFGGGKQALVSFKKKMQGMMSKPRRRAGDVDLDVGSPAAKQRGQADLDSARSKRRDDMTDAEKRAEMDEMARNRPREIDPGSEHFDRYDIEVSAGDHTYRRRRDGKGWCRFTQKDCGVQDVEIPDSVHAQAKQIDAANVSRGKAQAQALGRDDPPPGYEWYAGPSGQPRVRNKSGNKGPGQIYDPDAPAGQRFSEKPPTRPKPDIEAPGRTVQGRDAKGRFLSTDGSAIQPGSVHENAVDAVVRGTSDIGSVSRQVRIETQNGTTVIVDNASRRGGRVKLTEAKGSATAGFTPNQRTGYPEIQRSGGTVTGTGTPEFPAGTVIPPTKVRVVRPEHLDRLNRMKGNQ
ncbi:MAG: DUF4157 domain-containing protein [Planctomycetota bacterium]